MRRNVMLGATLALSVALVGCGSGSSGKSSSNGTNAGGGVSTSTGVPGTPVAVDLGDTSGTNGRMTLTLSPASVPAGKVTFTVKNTGTIKHEMVVLATDASKLVVGGDGKVSEVSSAGEVGEVDVGKTKSATLDLKAGTYEVVCNLKDHYMLGMHAALTVI